MEDESLIVIFTENNMLYTGISSSLAKNECVNVRHGQNLLPKTIINASRIKLIIDCQIYLKGISPTFNMIIENKSITSIFWLTNGITGNVFPAHTGVNYIIDSRTDILSFRNTLEIDTKTSILNKKITIAKSVDLTLKERQLLIYFLSLKDMHLISKISHITIKTLYQHRSNIMKKMGFRQFCYLAFIYKKNIELFTSEVIGSLQTTSEI
ncbi:helix-turn-helix transcriptional regulator [Kluyvera ascorbata]